LAKKSSSNPAAQRGAVAVFIDSDNVKPAELNRVWPDIEKLGDIVQSRGYGDWSQPVLQPIRQTLDQLGVVRIQQDRYTQGKNATDMSLAIDVVDSRYAITFDIAVIVSADSDFTPLTNWLRSQRIYVVVAAPSKVSKALRQSADLHLNTDFSHSAPLKKTAPVPATKAEPVAEHLHPDENGLYDTHALYQRLKGMLHPSPTCRLSDFGLLLRKAAPTFNHKSYGSKTLRDWVGLFPQYFRFSDQEQNTVVLRDWSESGLLEEFTVILLKVRDELFARRGFNGQIDLVELELLLRRVSGSNARYLRGQELIGLLRQSQKHVYLLSLAEDLYDIWFFKGQQPSAAHAAGRQLLSQALWHCSKKTGQSFLFSRNQFVETLHELDPCFTAMKYGVSDINQLFEKNQELVSKLVLDGKDFFSPTYGEMGAAFEILQRNVAVARGAIAEHSDKPTWVPIGAHNSFFSEALGISQGRAAQNPFAVLGLLPDAFSCWKGDGPHTTPHGKVKGTGFFVLPLKAA
jgi:uncharacterized LabA/DUF88 family protein